MGMRVGGSSGSLNQQSIGQWQQRQQNVKDLFSAIKAGDLTGAQKAMNTISGNNNGNTDGPFVAISKALQNGDIQGAQQAAQAMHGHHHHAREAAAATSQSATASSNATSITFGLGQNINTTA